MIRVRLIAIQTGFMMRARPSTVHDPFQRPVAHAELGSGHHRTSRIDMPHHGVEGARLAGQSQR